MAVSRKTLPKTLLYLCHDCGTLLEVPIVDALKIVHLNHVAVYRGTPPVVVHCRRCAERFIRES